MASKKGNRNLVSVAAISIGLLFSALLTTYSQKPAPIYNITSSMIAMRDGVKLNTQVFAPNNTDEKLPILILRTPYGIGNLTSEQLAGAIPELTEDGYIVVQQDIRGRFKSEGQFVMLRQPRDPKDKNAIDESTDTYDTIEWLLKNVPNNNGRVGIAGTSYGAWLSVMAMLDPHPALKAVVEQASPADMFLGDDFHHNGAFRLSYGLEYTYMMESSKEISDTTKLVDLPDAYNWYLQLGALSNANAKYFNGKLPTWNDFVDHPDYDAFWKRQGFAPWLNKVTVPTLNVAGWWDQEDFYGPMKIYQLLERHDTDHKNFLVVGPWNHGGWSRSDGEKLGPVDFGSKTSEYYRRNVQARFLGYYLKDKADPGLPEALTFRTGENKWTRHDEWPPKQNVVAKKLYFQANGGLSFDRPQKTSEQAFDSYVSDPANPVPYRHQPIQVRSGWTTWLVEDQRFVQHRPDVLTFVSEPLKDDLTISGTVTANLFASTSGTDSDWVVKFIDVYPEDYAPDPKMAGYELMIADEVFRGRYYKGFDKPQPLVPNAATHYTIGFPGNDHTFLKGHRMMVQVQSTWFPLIDRNPQKFVENIFTANESDFQKATQRVYRSGANASYLDVPVAGGSH
jgi:putative CocE/NonD family hydrolase